MGSGRLYFTGLSWSVTEYVQECVTFGEHFSIGLLGTHWLIQAVIAH